MTGGSRFYIKIDAETNDSSNIIEWSESRRSSTCLDKRGVQRIYLVQRRKGEKRGFFQSHYPQFEKARDIQSEGDFKALERKIPFTDKSL